MAAALHGMGPAALVVGIAVGAVAIFLYLQQAHLDEARQAEELATLHCSRLRFDARWDRMAGDSAQRIQRAEKRARTVCAAARKVRRAAGHVAADISGDQSGMQHQVKKDFSLP